MKDMQQVDMKRRKLITAKEVREEYLDMDIRKIRRFLNRFCGYKKIGRTYYYSRLEVEALLLDEENGIEFTIETY